jgi:hypothetical protein
MYLSFSIFITPVLPQALKNKIIGMILINLTKTPLKHNASLSG